MAFVNGVYQADPRSPMERLYDFQKMQAGMQQLKAQQDMDAQRKQILAQSFTPGIAAHTEYEAASNPLAGLLGLDNQRPPYMGPSTAGNLVEKNVAPSQQPTQSPIPDLIGKQIEAKPASFDMQGALARLYGAGDLEGAEKLTNNEYRAALGNKASGGGASEKWYGNSKTIKGPDGKLYNQLLSSAGNMKLVPINGDLSGELKQMDLGGRKVWVNSYTGEPVQGFDVTLDPHQAWQQNEGAQASMEYTKSQAGAQGKAAGERASDQAEKVDKAGDAITELNSMISSLQMIPASAAGMKWENTKSFFTGGDPKIQEALGNIDRISGRMLEYAQKLPGAASDADRVQFMSSAGVMNDPNASPKRRIAAAQSAIGAYQRLIAKYGNGAQGGAPAPRPSTPNRGASMSSMPPAAQHAGRTIRDTATGITYKSDGRQWVRVK